MLKIRFKMSQATPQMRKFSARLIALEARKNKTSGTLTPAVLYVFEKLRPQLATLMGHSGFRALLSRALVLAKFEVSWLRTVQVEADGSLEGLEEHLARLDPDEFLQGTCILLAQLLGLLVAFIGENLTLGMVLEVWPKVPLNDWDLSKGVKHGKEK
jgi:hypothetical protein